MPRSGHLPSYYRDTFLASKCKVAFSGKRLFEWEGDAVEIDRIEKAMLKLAEHGKTTLDVLIQSIVLAIAKKRGFLSVGDPQPEMMAVMCFLLSQPTHHPDHPGHYRDYVPLWNFDFDIHADPNKRTFNIKVTGGGFTTKGQA